MPREFEIKNIITKGNSNDVSPKDITQKFSGENPMQAAKKAFTQIHKLSGGEECCYVFEISELPHFPKIFSYIGTRKRTENKNIISSVKSYKKSVAEHVQPVPQIEHVKIHIPVEFPKIEKKIVPVRSYRK